MTEAIQVVVPTIVIADYSFLLRLQTWNWKYLNWKVLPSYVLEFAYERNFSSFNFLH